MIEERSADFTIFAHVFYPDTWAQMASDLDAAIRQPFDLVITRPVGSDPVIKPRSSFLRVATEIEVDNRGRDILPFLTALNLSTIPSFDIGLKIHTKQSPHRLDGNGWRQFLVGSLLEAGVDGCLLGHKLLDGEPRIGLIAPKAHLLPLDGRTALNERAIMAVLERIERSQPTAQNKGVQRRRYQSSIPEGSRFPAGSMFWFRRHAMKKMINLDFSDMFERERGQLDGTAAHAFERLFAVLVEREGQLAAGMENVEPVLKSLDACLSPQELAHLITESLAHENPFVMPLAQFWRRNPTLFKLAHHVYTNLPQSTIRRLRRSLRRGR